MPSCGTESLAAAAAGWIDAVGGGWLGARMALKRGSGFVRWVLLVTVVGLVGKLAYDQAA